MKKLFVGLFTIATLFGNEGGNYFIDNFLISFDVPSEI